MRTRLIAATAVLLLAVAGLSAPAGAITHGVPDNGAHPYVGLVVFYDGAGAPLHRCTGTMISARVLLTAGHCTAGTASAQVWFQETVTTSLGYPLRGGFTGTPHTYEGFSMALPNTGDLGVVVLRQRPGVGSASLPQAGALDAVAQGGNSADFDLVGYGLQDVRPQVMADRTRLKATARIVNLNSAITDGYNLQSTNAVGTGGGTCSGDSGGPILLAGTRTVVAVNSFGFNANCVGADFSYRVDTSWSLEFIGRYT